MKRHIALLRGINIRGKNKLPMAELKQGFEGLGYTEVKTYLNSGNVIFSGEETDSAQYPRFCYPSRRIEGDFTLCTPLVGR